MAEAATTTKTNTKANQGSRFITSQTDVVACLKQLRDQRCTLSLNFEKQSSQYNAKLLDVYDDYFLIEDISPRDGNDLVKQGAHFTISARGQGLFAFIEETRVVKSSAERGLPYFHVPLPQSVLLQQRRRNVRFRLPYTVRTKGSTITINEEAQVAGNILDISAGGCRAEFSASQSQYLLSGTTYPGSKIAISDMLELHSEAIIRHTTEIASIQKVVVGIEFTKMVVTDRRRLEHFIQIIAKNSDPL